MSLGGPLWHNSGFLKLWGAHTISLVGSQVTLIALPLTAILSLSASSMDVGVLAAAAYLPFLLIGLPAGVWANRMSLRFVLIGADVGRALLLLGIPIAYRLGVLSLWILVPVTFANGVLTVFADIAHQSVLPAIVQKSELSDGNTKLQMSYSVAELSGPAIGGFLVKLLGAPISVVADAGSFVLSALLLASTPSLKTPPHAESEVDGPESRLGFQMREGLAYVGRHPLLRPIVLCMAGANLFDLYGMVLTALPIYAFRELQLTPMEFGIVLAVANVGAVLGALANRAVSAKLGVGRTLIAAAFLPGLGVLALTLATRENAMWVLAPALGVAGVGISLFNVNQLSLRQHITPPRLLTRMNATIRFVIWGMIPAGALLGGLLVEQLGVRRTLVVAGVGSLLSTLPLLLSRIRSLDRIPQIPENEEEGESESCPDPG